MALDSHPAAKSSITNCSVGTTSNKTSNNCVPPAITTEASPVQHQSQHCPMMTKSSSIWPLGSAAKSQIMLTKTSANSILSSDPVTAAAVAAGARTATQSDAASLLKAARTKHVVHIMPTGNSSIKSPMGCGVSTHSEANPNARFISSSMATAQAASVPCPGLAKASSSTAQHTQSTLITSPNSLSEQINLGLAKATSPPPQVKASSSTTQHTQSTPVTSLSMLSDQTDAEMSPKQDVVTVEGIEVLGSQEVANDEVRKDGGHVFVTEASEQVLEAKAALPNREAELKSQVAVPESSNASPKLTMNESDLANDTGNHDKGSQKADDDTKVTWTSIKEAENQSAFPVNGKNPSAINKQADLLSASTDES